MALLTKYGRFSMPTFHPATQVISDVGFTPKAILFFQHHMVGEANQTNWEMPIGVATGPNDEFVVNISSDAQAVMSRQRDENNAIIGGYSTNSTVNQFSAHVSSFDVNGFTLDWNTPAFANTYTAHDIHYLALGGDDVINAGVINAGTYTSTGNYTYSGLNFQPNSLFLITSLMGGGASPTSLSLGVATPSDQWIIQGSAYYASYGAYMRMRSGQSVGIIRGNNGSVQGTGTVTSFNADGFTMNITATSSTGTTLDVLALQLANPVKVGGFQKPTTPTATQSITIGKTPKALWTHSGAALPSPNSTINFKWTQGITDGTNSYSPTMIRYAQPTSAGFIRYTHDFSMASGYSHLPSTQGDADISFGDDGFTFDWTSSNTSAFEVMYIAFVETFVEPPFDADYDLAATSGLAVSASARKTSTLDAAISSDIAVTAQVARQSAYALAAVADLDFSSTRTLTDSIIAAMQSGITLSAARQRESFYALTSAAELGVDADILKDASFTLSGELDFYYSTFQTLFGEFTLAADSHLAYAGKVDAVAAFTINAHLAAAIRATRVLDSSMVAGIGTEFDLFSTRIREDELSIAALSYMEAQGMLLVNARYLMETESGILVVSGADMRGDVAAIITSDMDYRAKPTLVKTYEDAFSRVSNTLKTTRQRPIIRTIIHPIKRGRES